MMFRRSPMEESMLLFGCHDAEEDLFKAESSLMRLPRVSAYSRDPSGAKKQYVQDQVMEMAAEVGGIVFEKEGGAMVCGSVRPISHFGKAESKKASFAV